jgi:hypothetical protein
MASARDLSKIDAFNKTRLKIQSKIYLSKSSPQFGEHMGWSRAHLARLDSLAWLLHKYHKNISNHHIKRNGKSGTRGITAVTFSSSGDLLQSFVESFFRTAVE